MSGKNYTNNEDDYSVDYENEDFEDFDSPINKSIRKITTPYQKSPKQLQYKSDSEEEENEEAQEENNIDGQDLETYMKSISNISKNNNFLNGTNNNEQVVSSEVNPLDGLVPNKNNTEEENLRIKLGYSSSPSPDKKSLRLHNSSISIREGSGFISPRKSIVAFSATTTLADKDANGDYINTFKNLLNESPSKKPFKNSYHLSSNANTNTSPHNSDNTIHINNNNSSSSSNNYSIPHHPHKEPAYSKDHKENAERVDALLMELFPERFEQKKRQTKPTKKNSHHQKNQVFGLGAISSEYIASTSARLVPSSGSDNSNINRQLINRDMFSSSDDNYNNNSIGNISNVNNKSIPILEQQIKLLKKELKSKDEKISRLTDHAVMMGNHMDKLKGENAQLNYNLKEAQMENEAKDARLDQAIKQRKKAAKKKNAIVNGGDGCENEIAHLKEREVALLDAIEELSNQNEDLILKLKESMESELIQSSKRAAQISHNITSLVLPTIRGTCGVASVGHRDQVENNSQHKRSTRKKK